MNEDDDDIEDGQDDTVPDGYDYTNEFTGSFNYMTEFF